VSRDEEETPATPLLPPERRRQSTVFKDPRIDKLISWGLGMVGTIILGVGTFFINGFRDGIKDIQKDLGSVKLEVSASRTEIKSEISDLRTEIALLKQRDTVVGELKSSLLRLEDRLLRLERGGGK